MISQNGQKWLLLIHQIPPKPNALRVKIWRRLNQVGAVAIKQSVYIMPHSEQAQEDFSWTLREIVDGGGDGSISEVRFAEGLTDEQIVSLFQAARKSDYEKIIQKTNQLIADWSSGKVNLQDPAAKSAVQVTKIQRRFDEIAAIDFFQAPERATAEILIRDLFALLSDHKSDPVPVKDKLSELKHKIWVTRKNIFVDRIASAWLIRRFVNQDAEFKFVDAASYAPRHGEIRFDMFGGEYTHEGDQCTFEVMIKRLGLQDHGLMALAEVVHDIDLKDAKYQRSETNGLYALLSGLTASQPEDDKRMKEGGQFIESLFAFFQRQRGNNLSKEVKSPI